MSQKYARRETLVRLLRAVELCSMSPKELFDTAELPGKGSRWLSAQATATESHSTEPEQYVSMDMVYALWDAALSRLSGPALMRAALASLTLPELGPFAFLSMTAPSLRETLRCQQRNFDLVTNSGHWEVRAGNDTHTLVWHRPPTSLGQCAANEAILAHVAQDLSIVCGREVPIRAVTLRHSAFGTAAELRRSFDAPVRHDSACDSLTIDSELLDLEPARSQPHMFEFFKKHVRLSLASVRRGDNLLVRVQRSIEQALGQPDLSVALIAEQQAIHPRTLHRRLRAAGTSFSTELDLARQRRALHLVLMTRLPMTEVARELGFSDQASFNRAFRRWYGSAPTGLRRGPGGGG